MTKWTNRLDSLVDGSLELAAAMKTLRLPRLKYWKPGHVSLEWPVDPGMLTRDGTLFGGYIAALADQALALAALTVLTDDEAITTADLRVTFLRPITGGRLSIDATVIHRSRNMVHVDVSFTRDDGKLVGRASATQVVLRENPG